MKKILMALAALMAILPAFGQLNDAHQIWKRNIDSAAPSDQNCLIWVASTKKWTPSTCPGGGGTAVAPYSTTFSSQTSVSISAATHGQGTLAVAQCFSADTPRVAVACSYTRDSSGNLVFTFSPSQSGQIEVGSGGGSVSGSGNPAGSTNAIQKNGGSNTFAASLGTDDGTTFTYSGTGGVSAPKLISTVSTGTAPFTVTSTTVVANLNASALGGATFAAPGAIGGTTPAAGHFTTLDTTGAISSGTSPPSVTAGTGGVLAGAEGTVPSVCAASAVDCLYWDSTQHGPLLSRNNGSYLPIPQGPASTTSGHIASWNSTNGGLLADGGAVAANLVVASSPGVGLCHFAGSTQTCTSSLVVAADITSATITGTQIASSIALAGSPTTTTQSAKDNSTKIATTAYVDAPVATATGTTHSLTGPREYWSCTGTCTVTPPVPVAGYEFCVFNDDNVSSAITLAALGSSAMYENSARTAYGTAGTGTLVVSAAAANKVCIVGRDSTHYWTVSYNGSVTVN